MENENGTSWRNLQSVDTTVTVIEALAELDNAGVTEVASHTGLSKSSAHSYLATLTEAGYLVKNDGEYRLSYQFLLLGESVRNSSLLFRFGREKAQELATETGHYVHLYTEENGLGVNIFEARGEHAEDYDYQSLKLQRREPMHVTASGKAVLAYLPESRVRTIVGTHDLEAYTEQTITDEDALLQELTAVRERGFAVNDEEEVRGFRAVAAPVRADNGGVLGSISVSGPKTFLSGDTFTERIPERVVNASDMISVAINMTDVRKKSGNRSVG